MSRSKSSAHTAAWAAAVLLCTLICRPAALAQSKAPAAAPSATAPRLDELRQLFQNPPDDARIMMRWWWFGPAVTNAELEREMRTMKEGGIGGVEVQPVYPLALDDPQRGAKNLPFLSDGFLASLRFVSHKAKELGLRMDLTLGSGWPWGGPQVPVTQAAGMLRIAHGKAEGSARRVPLPYIAEGEELLAAFLAPAPGSPAAPSSFQPLTDIHDGFVAVPAGTAGARELLFFIASRTGMMVKRPAVGAEGFVVDHYDRAAVEHYLRTVGDRLLSAFDADPPYAIFGDSLEVYNSDWTSDFLQEFRRRRGYDLKPYLPALVSDLGPTTLDIRHDWARTLTELFNERFASTVHEWSRRNHTRFRMQGYGIPPAELSSSALTDLPEGEGAQWKTLAATRWAASASHIYGVPITSSETWTWLHSPVFRATPLDMKAEADRHFLQGINQLIGHGWPYTPPYVEYPGWRFYAAAVFDEKDPWWIVMPDIARYLQRVSFVLRQGKPANDVAFYLPNSDAWAHLTPGHVNLFETLRAQLGSEVVGDVLDAGFNLDFFDDDALQRVGKVGQGALSLGPNAYRVVILPGVERIPLPTYQKLEEFVRAGGILVATGRLPGAAPGFAASAAEQEQVREITRRLFEGTSPPARFVQDESRLGAQLVSLATADVAFSPAAADIGVVHRRTPDADIYFLANTSQFPVKTTATFRVSANHAEWWDPISGHIAPANAEAAAHSSKVATELEPYGSRVLVLSNSASQAPALASPSAAGSTIDLSSNWQVTFSNNGKTVAMEHLRSWTDDEDTRYFSGTATYEKTVPITADSLRRGSSVRLEFGDDKPIPPQPLRNGMQAWLEAPVREAAVVYVNDQRAGSVWCPPYALEVTPFLQPGDNKLRIVVANLALNYMAGHRLPDYRLLNSRYGVRFEAQDMDKVQPIPAGLFGPVRLVFGTAKQ